MRAWRLADADWNSWPGGLTDAQTWSQAVLLDLGGIELGVYDAAEELAPDRLAEVSRLVDATGIPVVAVLLSLPVARWPQGAMSGEVERLLAQVDACAKVCRQLGLSTLGLWPGADPAGVDVTTCVRRVVERAAPVRVALEYKPGTAVATAAEALALCAQVPELGVLLDTGHAFAAAEDPAAVVRQLGTKLLHCHLGDAAVGGGDDDLPCGRVHDFGAFVAALDATGYAGTASFDLYGAIIAGEITGLDAVCESRDHIRSRSR